MTATPPGQPTALDDARAYLRDAQAHGYQEEDLAAAQAAALISIAEALHQLTARATNKETT